MRKEKVMELKPLYDNIVVKPDTPEEMKGRIVIPEKYRSNKTTGVVLAVGDGRHNNNGELVPLIVKEGDKVMWGSGSGIMVGENKILVKEQHLLAILKDD